LENLNAVSFSRYYYRIKHPLDYELISTLENRVRIANNLSSLTFQLKTLSTGVLQVQTKLLCPEMKGKHDRNIRTRLGAEMVAPNTYTIRGGAFNNI
jgi:hypothetical protein